MRGGNADHRIGQRIVERDFSRAVASPWRARTLSPATTLNVSSVRALASARGGRAALVACSGGERRTMGSLK